MISGLIDNFEIYLIPMKEENNLVSRVKHYSQVTTSLLLPQNLL